MRSLRVMATVQRPRFPRIDRIDRIDKHPFQCQTETSTPGPKQHRLPGAKTELPGIGSYVIDSPEDKNMGVRQQCLRFQESHRGILRAKIESLPDIPKRCHLKSVPVVTMKDTPTATDSPDTLDMATPPGSSSPVDTANGKARGRKDRRAFQHFVARETGVKIPPPQEELFSRSPIGRLSHGSPSMQQSGAPITGFGVRKPKPAGRDFDNFRKEYTNLTVNLELTEPDHVTCKATERELDSQADYRRQLTFYLSPIRTNGQIRDGGQGAHGSTGETNSVLRNIPKDKIGSSTRHQIWASNLRLGELLVQQNRATPGLKRKFAASRTRSRSMETLGNNSNTKTVPHIYRASNSKPFIYGSPLNRFKRGKALAKDDDEGDDESDDESDEEEAWLNMADTPVIENNVYDRYANVKLPRCRVQPAGTART
ncbi:hypothetical protein EGW08_017731 [Elysia chlorotica]|uniref:Uncharacterized protein n=1 Tax=Elysia chlorotica TaxID=188477 RepID=A0A3S0ZCG5_ELYCH|nr:hypothetical protein EGW08_017731 [Elysia chlorotica]